MAELDTDRVYVPCGPSIESFVGGYRIHTAPQWIDIWGKWTPIDEAVTLEHDVVDGSWTVRCVDGRWIRLEWDETSRQGVLDATVSRKTDIRSGFGPQLHARLAPDVVTARVTCSGGVVSDGVSWTFGPGSRVGLHLHQWMCRFVGSRTTDAEGRVMLDLTVAKAAVGGYDSKGWLASAWEWVKSVVGVYTGPVVDLDPTVLNQTGLGRGYTEEKDNWTDAREPDIAADDFCGVTTQETSDPFFSVSRGVLRFNTSAIVGTPSSVILTLTDDPTFSGGIVIRVSRKATAGQALDEAATYASSEIGTGTQMVADTLTTGDRTANVTSIFAAVVNYDLMLSNAKDIPTPQPGEGSNTAIIYAATLTVTMAPPTAIITPVAPDPRSTPVTSITITFNEAVSGFTTADLTLKLDGGANFITVGTTLTTSDNIVFTLGGNLGTLTTPPGSYVLTLNMAGVTNAAGEAGVGTVVESWITASGGGWIKEGFRPTP